MPKKCERQARNGKAKKATTSIDDLKSKREQDKARSEVR